MKKTILILITALAAGSIAHTATLYSYGPSTDYVTIGRQLEMEDGTTNASTTDTSRSFNTTDMSPNTTGYLGPEFIGGWETTGSLNQSMDFDPQINNNSGFAGGFDGILFALNNTTGSAGSHDLLVIGSSASTDLADLDTFTIGTEASSGASAAYSLEARAVIRISGSYYVSETTDLSPSSGVYGTDTLGFTSWFNYDPVTSVSSIGSSESLSGTDQVDAVGFLLTNSVTSSFGTGNLRIGVGEFEVTAIPEPSTFMLVGVALGSLVLFRRKR